MKVLINQAALPATFTVDELQRFPVNRNWLATGGTTSGWTVTIRSIDEATKQFCWMATDGNGQVDSCDLYEQGGLGKAHLPGVIEYQERVIKMRTPFIDTVTPWTWAALIDVPVIGGLIWWGLSRKK